MEPVSIGTQRQLFVDNFWIGELGSGVERRLHSPVRRNTAIAAEHSWEKGGVSYMVTFPDQGKYRAWYRCDCEMPPKGERLPLIAYAESDDGITWEKPTLGSIEFEGSRENNLVWAGPGNNIRARALTHVGPALWGHPAPRQLISPGALLPLHPAPSPP